MSARNVGGNCPIHALVRAGGWWAYTAHGQRVNHVSSMWCSFHRSQLTTAPVPEPCIPNTRFWPVHVSEVVKRSRGDYAVKPCSNLHRRRFIYLSMPATPREVRASLNRCILSQCRRLPETTPAGTSNMHNLRIISLWAKIPTRHRKI